MSTGHKLSLPLFAEISVGDPTTPQTRPTIERARQRLGGRGYSLAGIGRIVLVDSPRVGKLVGVLIFASETEHDVLLESGVVRRTSRGSSLPYGGEVPDLLSRFAADVQVFATLREQDALCFEFAPGKTATGTLIEKCRYGALVGTAEGRVLAVGFRKLWPRASGCC